MDNFPVNQCPYCVEDRPINQELGHGKQFLQELAEINPEKALKLGQKVG
jgi:hypothetical protein